MIELTQEQVLAIDEQVSPLQVIDPRSGDVYVLIRKNVYDLTCKIVGAGKGKIWDDEADNDIIRKRA
ncbi:MAG TPA: hypothetical protein VGL71_14350 [Urbifossiella sp.]|jgi:hypothetical protein